MWTSQGVCTTVSEWTSVWCRWRPEWLCVSPSVWCWSSCLRMTDTPRIRPSRPERCGQRNTPERRSAASEERSYTWAGETERERETGELKLKHNRNDVNTKGFSYSGSGLCDRLFLDLLLTAQRDPWMRLWSFWHSHVLLLFIIYQLLIITLYWRLQTQSI